MVRVWLWVFGATFAVYVFALAPDMGWLDSSELAAAAWTLGVAHPPGHPLPSLLGRACALVPLGTVAFRVGLASALAGAAAAAQAARLGRLVARRARLPAQSDARVDGALGAAAGVAFGLSYAAAFQAVRPEVYALATEQFKIAPGEVVFVSSNRWDVMGAAAFGFPTAWVNRTKMPEKYDPAPSATLADLGR